MDGKDISIRVTSYRENWKNNSVGRVTWVKLEMLFYLLLQKGVGGWIFVRGLVFIRALFGCLTVPARGDTGGGLPPMVPPNWLPGFHSHLPVAQSAARG